MANLLSQGARFGMGFFDFLKVPDIHAGVNEYHAAAGGVLLDVRTPPGVPGGSYSRQCQCPPAISRGYSGGCRRPEYAHICLLPLRKQKFSGCCILGRMGYGNIKNIGGIAAWSGKVEHDDE